MGMGLSSESAIEASAAVTASTGGGMFASVFASAKS